MNLALLWVSYGLFLLVAVALYMLRAIERTFERVSLPQLFYMLYMMGVAAFASSVMANVPLALTFAAAPVVMILWFLHSPEEDAADQKAAELQRELTAYRERLKEAPEDILALDALGDLYLRIGAAAPALEQYGRLLEIYVKKGDAARLVASLRAKMSALEACPAAGDPKTAALLRLCPDCRAFLPRMSAGCRHCGRRFFRDDWSWRIARVDALLEGHRMTRVMAFGLLFLPYLFGCGKVAYGLLWLSWTLAFAVSDPEKTAAPERPEELFPSNFWGCAAMFLVLSFALFEGGKPPAPRPTAKAAAAARAAGLRAELSKGLAAAGARGDLDRVALGTTTLREMFETAARQGVAPSTAVVAALAEGDLGAIQKTLEADIEAARARGDLEKVYSDGVTYRQILDEAKDGVPGEGIEKVLAGARERGDLDRIRVQGKSLAQYEQEAKDISAKADELKALHEKEAAEAMGIDPGKESPQQVVVEAIRLLSTPERDARMQGAQILCDLRFAAYGESAIPALEAVRTGTDDDASGFADLALKRIRFCAKSPLCRSKYRK